MATIHGYRLQRPAASRKSGGSLLANVILPSTALAEAKMDQIESMHGSSETVETRGF